jgi:hypothetical protein
MNTIPWNRRTGHVGACFFTVSLLASSLFAQQNPALPARTPAPVRPAVKRTVYVVSPANLQAALSATLPGDDLVCEGVWTGNFTLPPGGPAILEAGPNGCKIISPNTQPALCNISETCGIGWRGNKPDRAIHDWWLQGLEITTSGPQGIYDAVMIADDCDPDPTGMPARITLDAMNIHGQTNTDSQQNGIYADGTWISVLNSRVTDWQSSGTLLSEANGIKSVCGVGPYLMEGNYIEASSQGIFFAAPGVSPTGVSWMQTPSDITINNNVITRSEAWIGMNWVFKNGFECKNCERVLFENNQVTHIWPGSQNGAGVLLTPRVGLGTPPQTFSVVQDITLLNNVLIDVGIGFGVASYDNLACTPSMGCAHSARIRIANNAVSTSTHPTGVNQATYGWCIQLDFANAVTVNGLQCSTNGYFSIFVDNAPTQNFILENSSRLSTPRPDNPQVPATSCRTSRCRASARLSLCRRGSRFVLRASWVGVSRRQNPNEP